MRSFDRVSARAYLAAFGVPLATADEVLTGFDFRQAVYERHFHVADHLYQLIRLPSAAKPFGHRGSWYVRIPVNVTDDSGGS